MNNKRSPEHCLKAKSSGSKIKFIPMTRFSKIGVFLSLPLLGSSQVLFRNGAVSEWLIELEIKKLCSAAVAI
jgi:hypothetical protein